MVIIPYEGFTGKFFFLDSSDLSVNPLPRVPACSFSQDPVDSRRYEFDGYNYNTAVSGNGACPVSPVRDDDPNGVMILL